MTHERTKPSAKTARFESQLRDVALGYPEAHEDFPWGERAIKVRGKVFLFMSASANGLSLSTKLTHSSAMALALPFASPTGYGLGKSGWVSARFAPNETPPIEILSAWIDESYRAVAPKKLLATIPSAHDAAADATPKKSAAKKKTAKASSRKRASPKQKKTTKTRRA